MAARPAPPSSAAARWSALALALLLAVGADAAPGLALEHERSTLDDGSPDWTAWRLWLKDLAPDGTGWATVADERRFGEQDTTFAAGGRWRRHQQLRVDYELAFSPTCRVAACAGARLGAALGVAEGLELRLGARRTRYADDSVSVLDAGAEWYFGAHRAAYTAFVGELGGGPTATSHLLQLDRYFGERGRLGAFAVEGDEVTRVDANTVVAAPVRSWGLRLALPLGRYELELGAERHQQGAFYGREAVRIGVRRAL